MFFSKEIDIAGTGLALTQPRALVIDFSSQFHTELINLLIPYPQKDHALGSITLPFRYEVSLLSQLSSKGI